jgi:transcriptional regulator with XRE-family HTH domain
MPDSPESVDQPAEPVGAILARWRKRRRLTGQVLGERVGMSQAKISRLETGAVSAEPADVRLLAEELGMPATEVERVVELAEQADYQLTDWSSAQPDLAAFQREINRIEAAAKELWVFQPTVVPGLLQTSEYARSIMSSVKEVVADDRLADSEFAVSEAVNARMQRNMVLVGRDRRFRFLITEQVLRNRVCQPAEMIAQIDRMRNVAAYPNVDLSIVLDDADLPIATYHGFFVADERWVTVDLFNASLKAGSREAVRAYRRIFGALENVATAEVNEVFDRYQAYWTRTLLSKSAAS